MKVDQNNAILVEHMMLKFIQELKLQIILIVYVENLAIVDAAITTAKHVEKELKIANESKQVYILEDQIAQLSKQVNTLARGDFKESQSSIHQKEVVSRKNYYTSTIKMKDT